MRSGSLTAFALPRAGGPRSQPDHPDRTGAVVRGEALPTPGRRMPGPCCPWRPRSGTRKVLEDAISLRRGEASLPRPSVVNVIQIRTIDQDRLDERIGALAPERLIEMLRGLVLVFGIDERHLVDE